MYVYTRMPIDVVVDDAFIFITCFRFDFISRSKARVLTFHSTR